MKPRISVLMCVYNAESTLRESLDSLFRQTYPNFELVVIDDGSSDQTPNILAAYSDPRLVVKRISNSGLTRALNVGLSLVQGEYIARMDSDDVAHPERLKRQVAYLDEHPEIGVLGTGYEVLTESGFVQTPHVPALITNEEILKAFPKFNPICHGSVMIRRETMQKTGGYDERFKYAQDYDLWIRMARHCQFANLIDVLLKRREGKQTYEKESEQNWTGVYIRYKAIREGNFKWFHVVYLLRPVLVAVTPIKLKKFVRKLLHG